MKDLYESKISVKRWIIYDIFGNLGWIIYYVVSYQMWKGGLTSSYVLVPAALMLVGLVELISERIAKLDYVLPRGRLYRGFGALTLGGICGAVYGAVSFGIYRLPQFLWLLAGGALCGVFGGLLFREYHPVKG